MAVSRYRVGILTAVFVLSGCATSGKEVTQEQMAQFHRGTTTVQDVIGKLGAPTSSMITADGKRMLMYSFAHVQMRAASMIPIVGIFAGGADMRTSYVTFTFDSSGKLVDYLAGASAMGTGTGLSAGTFTPQTPDQPREAKSAPISN